MADLPKPPRAFGPGRRSVLRGLAGTGLALVLGGCGSGGAMGAGPAPTPSPTPSPSARTRTWRMGFSPLSPRGTVASVIQGIDLWSQRADLAIVHEELPWADLLAGMTPQAILQRDKVELVTYLRSKGLQLTVMLDLTNGLARESESAALVTAGRSLAEPAVQVLARDYALAVQAMLSPDWLGLAAETNLVRIAAPAPVYQAVKDTANAIEAALAASGASARRFISVQAEVAWGKLGGTGQFAGIAQDLADFAFTRAIGLSSYPYFGFDQPADVPADYYSRIRGTSGLPIIVTEGGWSSTSVGTVTSSPQEQARYYPVHADLLDSVGALAWFQLAFADLDISALPQPVPTNLPLFVTLGLTDVDFRAKPALTQWDELFARRKV